MRQPLRGAPHGQHDAAVRADHPHGIEAGGANTRAGDHHDRVRDGRPAVAVDENSPDDRLYFGFFVELAAGERSEKTKSEKKAHLVISYQLSALSKNGYRADRLLADSLTTDN